MRRPRGYRQKKVSVQSSIDQDAKMTLDMLGFSIPKLIEELLLNVAGTRKCPLCERELKPRITGRAIKPL